MSAEATRPWTAEDVEQLGHYLLSEISMNEPWLDKRRLAEHLSCSVRSIEYAVEEGMPHAIIFGRVKFQVPAVRAWLEQHGHLERRGGQIRSEVLRQGGHQ